jgi:DNA repair exonuclease SbcCD ATPase subunit
MSKIIKLTSENVKRLQAVEITPKGNVIVIGGKNGAGKSSVLDSIQYALGGDTDDRMPVRRGEEKAKVVLDLGDIIVKRTFTAAGGTSLVVTNADGVRQASPQGILDKLTGKLTFDPLDFSRQKPEKQAETLRALVGLDFAEHDARASTLYNERTAVNREAKQLQARLAAMPRHEDAPAAEVSAADILAEQQKAAAVNAANATARNRAVSLRGQANVEASAVTRASNEATGIENSIAKLQKQLVAALASAELQKKTSDAAHNAATDAEIECEKLKDVDLTPFKSRIFDVETGNRKVRQNSERAEVVKLFKAKSDAADELTRKLEAMDADKRRKSTTAKYPIDGLMFDTAGGVTLNGIPFDQCSSAEQLRVSVAIGLALNPKLKVLLIRDGSLLDDESMKLLLDMAASADAQVWMERVGTDATTSVVIEDGAVAAQPQQKELV